MQCRSGQKGFSITTFDMMRKEGKAVCNYVSWVCDFCEMQCGEEVEDETGLCKNTMDQTVGR